MILPLLTAAPELNALGQSLATRWALPLNPEVNHGLVLWLDESGLALKTLDDNKMGVVRVDFTSDQMQWRRKHGGGKQEAIAKAVGLKGRSSLTVLDATAGLGRDGFLLANLGCEVTLLERQLAVAALLDDGLRRAYADDELGQWLPKRLTLLAENSIEWLTQTAQAFDVVYLDPMFPHRKKSAQVKKEMFLFQQLLGPDEDADALLAPALKCARQRVVVKRPAKAPYLADQPADYSLKGKANRFDVYLIPIRIKV